MTKMNPEVKARWVAALRSGEYKQGRDQLRKGDTFCCLGVACDLYAKESGEHWDGDRFLLNSYGLPDVVANWLEWDEDEPVEIRGRRGAVAWHNDDNNATFAEIADAIEAQL